jgi:ferric-dicitrate binding protein FerR (iron transport regulator)
MDTDRLNYLLERHVDHELSPEEQVELDAWYEEQQQSGTDMISSTAAPSYIEDMSRDILHRIQQGQKKKRGRLIHWLGWVAAASVVGLATLLYVLNPAERRQTSQELAEVKVTTNDTYTVSAVSADTSFYLPDSSFVTLSPGTMIAWGAHFNDSTRTISLTKGNGYFKVRKDKSRPFIVISQDISTTALGTAFTVSSPESGKVDITLHEGKVVVHTKTQRFKPVYMMAGENLAVNVTTQIAVRSTAQKKPLTVVKNTNTIQSAKTRAPEVLEFRQDTLSYVLNSIAAFYNIHISFDHEVVAMSDFSGKVRRSDKPSVILRKIALLYHLELVETNGSFQFRKQ